MPRPADDWWADVEQDFLACLEGDGSTSIATIARRLAISEDAASSLVAILAREGKVRISVVERVRRGDEAAEERDTMADQEQTALWADANRRVLDDLSAADLQADRRERQGAQPGRGSRARDGRADRSARSGNAVDQRVPRSRGGAPSRLS
ncbi:MAG: hypothetical protein DMD89_32245 [Candidatus Rokuibacteriota bacterium]|nr:MAG: hypothetical protein DMD89_32245 [Candidatus Rokubacteria bacterium]